MTGGCWSLLEISQELAGVCWSVLGALERYLEVAGAHWRFLEALEQAHTQPIVQSSGTVTAA